jgi:hypothetical protein
MIHSIRRAEKGFFQPQDQRYFQGEAVSLAVPPEVFMLTLDQFRDVSNCRVFRDDVDPLTLYVIPFTPRIAVDDQGKPIISLVWYRRKLQNLTDEERKTRLGGGILTLSAELSVTSDQEASIRSAVASDPEVKQRVAATLGDWWRNQAKQDEKKLAAAFKVGMVPIKEGTVQISILAENPDPAHPGEFVGQLVGAGQVSMLGNMRASFMAKLTQDGVVLLWDMLEKNLAAIRVAYDLKFDHRLDAVRMVVWCDAKKAYRAIHTQWQDLQDNASFSTRTSGNNTSLTFGHDTSHRAGDVLSVVATASQASSVVITPEADSKVVTPDEMQELMKSGNDMIAQFLSSTILDFKPGADAKFQDQPTLATDLPEYDGKKYGHYGINYYNLKDWSESMEATLNSVFTSKAVLEGTLGPNDNLSNILKGQRVSDYRTQVELDDDFYQYLDVQVVCTSNFDEDPLDLVEAHVSYQGTGPQGDINTAKDFLFNKGTQPQRFSTYLAAPDKRNYDYTYTVFYKGGGSKMTSSGKSDQSILVLDTDRLGILRVDVEIGMIDWTQIRTAIVKMSYGAGSLGKQTEFTLSQTAPKQTWNEVIGRDVTDPYSYSLTFIDTENRRIEIPETTSRERHLIINQPLQQQLEVAVIPAGEFGADGLISKIAVALRYRDAADQYNADEILILDDAKKNQTWKIPLVNPNLTTYEYQTTVFYSDGVTRTDDWKPTDAKVLAVGDPYGFRVQITPRLLKGYAFGKIQLAFDDSAASIHAERTFQIDDFAKPLFWRFRLGSPDRHTYRYTLTLYKDDGTETDLPETPSDQEVLVLKPPPAQAVGGGH